MNAIPKALAMANPIAAYVATFAGVVSSKFAIDAVANEKDDAGTEKVDGNKPPEIDLTEEEYDYRYIKEVKCYDAFNECERPIEKCEAELYSCIEAA